MAPLEPEAEGAVGLVGLKDWGGFGGASQEWVLPLTPKKKNI